MAVVYCFCSPYHQLHLGWDSSCHFFIAIIVFSLPSCHVRCIPLWSSLSCQVITHELLPMCAPRLSHSHKIIHKIPGPATSASPGILLEMQILRLHSWPAELETLRWHPAVYILTRACWYSLKFEHYRVNKQTLERKKIKLPRSNMRKENTGLPMHKFFLGCHNEVPQIG